MQLSEYEIVILKPTSVFYSFLSSQIPAEQMPDVEILQYNTTAYLINRGEDEEEVLNEIERHYPTMFSHEIKRWLGGQAYNPIENSFLDFLCCFKFELHAQIALMEQSFKEGNCLLRVKPRSMLLKWMKESVAASEELTEIIAKVDLKQVAENGTVVIKNFNKMDEIKPFLYQNYPTIFEVEMSRMGGDEFNWPKVDSYQSFKQYFKVDIHTQLVHLV